MARLFIPDNLSAQELRLYMDGAVAGRYYELELAKERVDHITDSASGSSSTEGPSAAPDGSAAPHLRKLTPSEALEMLTAEGDYDFDDNQDDWE